MYHHPGMQMAHGHHPQYTPYPPHMHPQMHPHGHHSLVYGQHPGQVMISSMSAMTQQQMTKKAKKKLKDPNAPKKASTAFMLWSLANRPRIREQFPELGFADIGKRLGEEWGQIDEKAKDHWQRQAGKDRERYEREQSAYLKSAAYSHWLDQASAISGKRRRKKDPNPPKQPLTAYVIFSNEVRDQVISENPAANFGEIGKIIGAKWRALVVEDRKPFEEKANIERERYNRNLGEYRRSQGVYEPLHHIPHLPATHPHSMYPMGNIGDLYEDDEGLGDDSN